MPQQWAPSVKPQGPPTPQLCHDEMVREVHTIVTSYMTYLNFPDEATRLATAAQMATSLITERLRA